jgi:K+-sensing histidine kinase KdpD
MSILRRATPIAVMLVIVSAVTTILWFVRPSGPQHPVFFYLLPIALVATLYGSWLAMLYGIAATVCAAFFLYDPLYSFYVTSPLDVGELIWFVALALIGAKCAADLLQPLLALPRHNRAAGDKRPL